MLVQYQEQKQIDKCKIRLKALILLSSNKLLAKMNNLLNILVNKVDKQQLSAIILKQIQMILLVLQLQQYSQIRLHVMYSFNNTGLRLMI
jgi:hypothetical protein